MACFFVACLLTGHFAEVVLASISVWRPAAIGPLRQVSELHLEDIVQETQPLILSSPLLMQSLEASSVDNFGSLRQAFGSGFVEVNDMDASDMTTRKVTLSDYIDALLEPKHAAPRLSEFGGRRFLLSRPELYANISAAYLQIVPDGFRDSLEVEPDEYEDMRAAAESGDDGESALAIWAADAKYRYNWHVDYVSGVLLTHLEGSKRLWLAPPEQQHLLYLRPNKENWEAVTVSAGRDPKRFPLLELLAPMAIDLRPGETIFIPCGWAHGLEYTGAAMSISCNLLPDFLSDILRDNPDWSPTNCSDFIEEDGHDVDDTENENEEDISSNGQDEEL